MSLSRTIFKKEIVAEFMAPRLRSGQAPKRLKKTRVVILGDGVPGIPKKQELVEFLAKRGFWVFYIRYRGTWESRGKFLKYPLQKDVLDTIGELPKGFKDLWSGQKYKLKPDEVFVVAGSFGGPAALFASLAKRVKKVVVVSPVVDWTAHSREEPWAKYIPFVTQAFGEAYRADRGVWKKLQSGKFYNPAQNPAIFDGGKILMFHAKDDESVGFRSVVKFSKQTGARLKLSKKGGHLKTSAIIPRHWAMIRKFLNS